jgi:DNA-binding NarL/FixJ family response regulator
MGAASAGNPTSVVLVDHRDVVSEGLRAVIESEPSIEVLAGPSELARALTLQGDPDVVVADIGVDPDGPELVVRLREAFPDTPVLVLTLLDDPDVVRAALAAGASGYMLKSAQPSELFEALETVASGGQYLQAALGISVARQHADDASSGEAPLKPAEREVFRLLVRGFTNSEIAARRGVSLRTVETQRANVLRELGVRTRAELVQFAREHGLAERGT